MLFLKGLKCELFHDGGFFCGVRRYPGLHRPSGEEG
jgi:hypothetical protein